MPSLSKQKGNIGEAKCLAKMVELGVPVCLPFGDNERYDMVIERNGKLEKKLVVKAHNFSSVAKEQIEKLGGKAEVI